MPASLRTALSGFAIGIAILSTNAVDVSAQKAIGEVIHRMDLHHRATVSVRASITLTSFNAQLKTADVHKGITNYLPETTTRKFYMRVDWATPVEEQIVVIGEAFELYRPRLNQVIRGKVSNVDRQARGALSFMSMSSNQVMANYDVMCLSEETFNDGVKVWHLILRPIKPASYKLSELWVDNDGMPRQAKIIEQNNDSTTVLVSNIQKNVTLKGDLFKLNYPKTVKKIKA
jgi:outer membrane lipoprotein-sorting protein